jgi:recombination protein RecT
MGLMPSGLLGEGYLVPYKNHGIMEAQFQAGYLGLVKLARQSGDVLDVEARVVRERDYLDIAFGTGGHVVHRPWIEGRDGPEDPGARQGVWFRAVLRNAPDHIGWMSAAQVEAIRRRSKAADTGPWVTDWEAMARKTVTRAELKWLPRSSALTRAMEAEEIIEGRAELVSDAVAPSGAQARLLAAGGIAVTEEPTAQNGSGAASEPEVDTDATDTASAPPEQADAGTAVCGSVADDGLMTGAICDLPADHDGAHKMGDAGSWPR